MGAIHARAVEEPPHKAACNGCCIAARKAKAQTCYSSHDIGQQNHWLQHGHKGSESHRAAFCESHVSVMEW